MGVSIKLLKKYIDGGKTYQNGDTATVPSDVADWLVGIGVAELVSEEPASPAGGSEPSDAIAPGFNRFKKKNRTEPVVDADIAQDTTSEKETEHGTE